MQATPNGTNYRTEAWVITTESEQLLNTEIDLAPIRDDEVLVAPIYGAWEANMTHAILRNPVDVCRLRQEPLIVLGNAGVVRVLQIGASVTKLHPDDICLFFGGAKLDASGFVQLVHAYDAPNTIGLLCKRTKVKSHNLFIIRPDTRFDLRQWAAFSIKYLTAWSNWKVAIRCLRAQQSEAELPSPFVWGWGGGTTLAEMDLARREGCLTTMISGNSGHREEIEACRVDAIDRNLFPELAFEGVRFGSDPDYRKRYKRSEADFMRMVRTRTGDRGVSIFIDYIGSPVSRVTLKALSRQGVITTAGWKQGMDISLVRANECIKRHIHVHTHYASLSEVSEAMDYAERSGWMPVITRTYPWLKIPELAHEHATGNVSSYFPVFEVNPE